MSDTFALYRQTVFLVEYVHAKKYESYAILTAFNPNGVSPHDDLEESKRLNKSYHLALFQDLSEIDNNSVFEITGCSPDLRHKEIGWGANISFQRAFELAQKYKQEAFFWVLDGQLHLVDARKSSNSPPELIGPICDRIVK
jgi:hypothetical protein